MKRPQNSQWWESFFFPTISRLDFSSKSAEQTKLQKDGQEIVEFFKYMVDTYVDLDEVHYQDRKTYDRCLKEMDQTLTLFADSYERYKQEMQDYHKIIEDRTSILIELLADIEAFPILASSYDEIMKWAHENLKGPWYYYDVTGESNTKAIIVLTDTTDQIFWRLTWYT